MSTQFASLCMIIDAKPLSCETCRNARYFVTLDTNRVFR